MGLRAFITRRIVYSIILIFFVITLNFFLFMILPGDPTDLFIPRGWTQEQRVELAIRLKDLWGIGGPLHIRYAKYVVNMFTWQFGEGMTVQRGYPVGQMILEHLPQTLVLLGISTVIGIGIGVALGVWASHKRGKIFDMVSTSAAIVSGSLPVFWVGMILILIFTMRLGWLPSAHFIPDEWVTNPPKPLSISGSFPNIIFSINPQETMRYLIDAARYIILPVATLTIFQFGGFLLLTRASMMEALTEDYIVTARAKGVPERNILYRHALKNASLPLITSAAISLGFIVSGAMITETVYTWAGLGTLIKNALNNNDYNILQGIFFVVALCVIVANFIADILYGIIDPRIKYG